MFSENAHKVWKNLGLTLLSKCQKKTHSTARANLNKSKELATNTTAASKYMPKRPRICTNWNPPFQTQLYLVKVPLNVSIVKQDLLHRKQILKILWSEVWKKRGFLIDADSGPLTVVFVTNSLLLFRLAPAMLWTGEIFKLGSFLTIS